MQDNNPQPVVSWVSVHGSAGDAYQIWTMDQFKSDTHRIVVTMHDGVPVSVALEPL